jgi:hypothetical protein
MYMPFGNDSREILESQFRFSDANFATIAPSIVLIWICIAPEFPARKNVSELGSQEMRLVDRALGSTIPTVPSVLNENFPVESVNTVCKESVPTLT